MNFTSKSIIYVITGLSISYSSCSDPKEAELVESLTKKVSMIRCDIKNTNDFYSYEYRFKYNSKGQIIAINEYSKDDYEINYQVNYSDKQITILETEEEIGRNRTYIGILNKTGLITELSFPDSEENIQLDYINNYLTTVVSENDNNTLSWNKYTNNLESFSWKWQNQPYESSEIRYNSSEIAKINLDINWLLYPTEGLSCLIHENIYSLIYAGQGYCGVKNTNYMTELHETYTYNGSNTVTSHSFSYTYEDGVPIKIEVANSNNTSRKETYTIFYGK